MKFSLIIPTQDRPDLVAVVVRHALLLDHPEFEVIVSDNSTTAEHRQNNRAALREYLDKSGFRIVYPPSVLSAPEHFEFALDFADGDHVIYLTDKMLILPDVLSRVESAVRDTNADIVNWAYAPYVIDDVGSPSGAGVLIEDTEFLKGPMEVFDPRAALQFKAGSEVSRTQQSMREFALGKIVFGSYSRRLIEAIRARSGTLFRGATHDYAAMVQALSVANTGVMLNICGIVFISLPRDKSLGSLTATDSQWALRYFRAFTDSDAIIDGLLVPGVYASQHNMVAHDYKKFLSVYGNMHFFNPANWLAAISADLNDKSKVWLDEQEKQAQLRLFSDYLARTGQRPNLRLRDRSPTICMRIRARLWRLLRPLTIRVHPNMAPPKFRETRLESLDDAVRHVSATRPIEPVR